MLLLLAQVMPPATTAVPCITCPKYYPTKGVNKGLLGEFPNKYCYRTKCQEDGVEKGYIKRQSKRSAPGGPGLSSAGPSAPPTNRMERDEAPVIATFKVAEILRIYGFRCVSGTSHAHALL